MHKSMQYQHLRNKKRPTKDCMKFYIFTLKHGDSPHLTTNFKVYDLEDPHIIGWHNSILLFLQNLIKSMIKPHS